MKTIKEEIMFEAGKILRSVFDEVVFLLEPGTDLADIDNFVYHFIENRNAKSALSMMGFPGQMSFAINNEVIQIAHKHRILQPGDLVSIDMTLYYKGFFVDKACSIVIEPKHYIKKYLVTAANSCLKVGIDNLKPGMRLNDLGRLIEQQASMMRVRIGKEFSGHTIGESHHMKPLVPNVASNSLDFLSPNTFVTIEPIVFYDYYTLSFKELEVHSNVLCAHVEETIFVGNNNIEVIT